MTTTEAVREIRLLLARELRRDPRDVATIRMMLWSIHTVLGDGCNPLIELRIRRWRRRAGLLKETHLSMPGS
jgi:hypothetical protein